MNVLIGPYRVTCPGGKEEGHFIRTFLLESPGMGFSWERQILSSEEGEGDD